jgi:hypothetical protein
MGHERYSPHKNINSHPFAHWEALERLGVMIRVDRVVNTKVVRGFGGTVGEVELKE